MENPDHNWPDPIGQPARPYPKTTRTYVCQTIFFGLSQTAICSTLVLRIVRIRSFVFKTRLSLTRPLFLPFQLDSRVNILWILSSVLIKCVPINPGGSFGKPFDSYSDKTFPIDIFLWDDPQDDLPILFSINFKFKPLGQINLVKVKMTHSLLFQINVVLF